MKILTIIILILFSSNTFAIEINYICNFETQYKNGKDGEWKNKLNTFIISYSENENIKIYNKDLEVSMDDMFVIFEDNNHIIGTYVDDTFKEDWGVTIGSINIDKKNRYVQLGYLNGTGGSTIRYAYCR